MQYRDLVEDLIEIEGEHRFTGWLAVVDEVHTLTAENLRSLSQYAPKQLFQIAVVPTGLRFDERMARWFFAATRTWRECEGVSVNELRAVMPSGVVSPNAKRVAVWEPIKRAFSRNVAKVSTANNLLLTAITGTDVQQYLTCIDLEKMLFACSCPAYNADDENSWKRHILCKHLMLSIYHHHEILLEKSGEDPREWISSLSAAQNHPHSDIMIPNWLYYFIKRVFAGMGFEAGRFENPIQVREVLELMGD